MTQCLRRSRPSTACSAGPNRACCRTAAWNSSSRRAMRAWSPRASSRMPRSRPLKRLSDGELPELRAQLVDPLDCGWIQHSTAGHAAAVVFARKPDGSWRICHDYRCLNATTRPAVEPLLHIDALLDDTQGSRRPRLRGGYCHHPTLTTPRRPATDPWWG